MTSNSRSGLWGASSHCWLSRSRCGTSHNISFITRSPSCRSILSGDDISVLWSVHSSNVTALQGPLDGTYLCPQCLVGSDISRLRHLYGHMQRVLWSLCNLQLYDVSTYILGHRNGCSGWWRRRYPHQPHISTVLHKTVGCRKVKVAILLLNDPLQERIVLLVTWCIFVNMESFSILWSVQSLPSSPCKFLDGRRKGSVSWLMLWLCYRICEVCGVYGDGKFQADVAYPYMIAINNLSQFVAMYCLVLFYRAHKEGLKPMRPIGKFLCIKAVVFFSFL